MPFWYKIQWLPDGPTTEYVGTRGNLYEFTETDRLDLDTEMIWCHGCRKFSDGEQLGTVAEIDQQIRGLRDPSSVWSPLYMDDEFFQMMCEVDGEQEAAEMRENLLQSTLADLERRRRWRETRQSPPKCIFCGTTEIVPLPIEETIPHPGGDGMIRIDLVGHCSTDFNNWYYTPEGDRIPRETRPSYWRLPGQDEPEHQDS